MRRLGDLLLGEALPCHSIAHPNQALRQNLRAQTAPVPERLYDRNPRQRLEMAARLAQANATDPDAADHEFRSHQVIEWHAAGDDISASLAGGEFDLVLAFRRLDCLGLDQCQFEIGLRFEESALPQEITISGQARAGNRPRPVPTSSVGAFAAGRCGSILRFRSTCKCSCSSNDEEVW